MRKVFGRPKSRRASLKLDDGMDVGMPGLDEFFSGQRLRGQRSQSEQRLRRGIG